MAIPLESHVGRRAGESDNILEMRGITKRFPGTLALSEVDLTIRRGEIHALVGQNGAGKSTLVKILAGDYGADAGSITIDGRIVEVHNARDARDLGIGIVYQDLSLLPNLTVADNVSLGREPGRGPVIDRGAGERRSREALARMGIGHIDARTKVERLTLPERQMVEIAKAISLSPRILILDEPTAALTQTETDSLFAVLRALKADNVGIIYITHRFNEILSLCDRGTVLRGGRVVDVFESRTGTLEHLVEATLGRQSEGVFHRESDQRSATQGEPVVKVEKLSVGARVHDISFSVHRGEIVGICGLLGAGQSDLGRALFGDRTGVCGTIEWYGQRVVLKDPHQARRLGIGFLSDNRREEGVFPDMLTEENVSIASLGGYVVSKLIPILRTRPLRRRASQVATGANVASVALRRPIRVLSGGNQQKALLSRWMMRDAEVLVLLEPTLGVDVGAKVEVYRQLESLARTGKSIIVISTDIPEILGLSDRIIVMYQGRIASILDSSDATEHNVVLAMQGARTDGSAG